MIYYYVNLPTITPAPPAPYSGINSPSSYIIHYKEWGLRLKKVLI